MATRFMPDPHEMRAMAGRFETYAQAVEDEARRMWALSQSVSGAGWSATAALGRHFQVIYEQAMRRSKGADRGQQLGRHGFGRRLQLGLTGGPEPARYMEEKWCCGTT